MCFLMWRSWRHCELKDTRSDKAHLNTGHAVENISLPQSTHNHNPVLNHFYRHARYWLKQKKKKKRKERKRKKKKERKLRKLWEKKALLKVGGRWHPTFALGQLQSDFLFKLLLWAPSNLQVQATRLPSIFLRALPWFPMPCHNHFFFVLSNTSYNLRPNLNLLPGVLVKAFKLHRNTKDK